MDLEKLGHLPISDKFKHVWNEADGLMTEWESFKKDAQPAADMIKSYRSNLQSIAEAFEGDGYFSNSYPPLHAKLTAKINVQIDHELRELEILLSSMRQKVTAFDTIFAGSVHDLKPMDIREHDELYFDDLEVVGELRRTMIQSWKRIYELEYYIETVNLNRFNSVFKEPLRLPFSVQKIN